MKDGDVLLLSDGRMLRVIQKDSEIEQIHEGIVQFIDRTEETYLDMDKLEVEVNLGNSPEIVGNFYSSWGMHKRLNEIGL